jgi:ankyrin repeat protein
MMAARMGHVDVVRLLCSAFADPRYSYSSHSALGWALRQKSTHPVPEESCLQVVKVLVESKAKICRPHLFHSHSDAMFSFLVSEVQRSDEVMNKEDLNTLLNLIPGAWNLSDTSVKCLCEHSADPNSSSTVGAGWSPFDTGLTQAIFHGRVDIVSYLCAIGTRMDHVVNWFDEKWVALDLALVSKRECDLEIASHLIRARAEVSKLRWACNYTCGACMTAREVSAKPVTALSAEDLPVAFARVDKFAAAGRALFKASLSISH